MLLKRNIDKYIIVIELLSASAHNPLDYITVVNQQKK